MPRGGFRIGAGRPGRGLKVEHCRRLNILELARAGLLSEGFQNTWQWRDSVTGVVKSEVSISTAENCLTLLYSFNGQPMLDSIPITRSPCANVGGVRPWFICPGCHSRRLVLRLRWGRFRCRSCQDLPYASQSEDAIARTWRKQEKLEAKLAPNWRRPKGMTTERYDRIMDRLFAVEMHRDLMMDSAITQMIQRGWK